MQRQIPASAGGSGVSPEAFEKLASTTHAMQRSLSSLADQVQSSGGKGTPRHSSSLRSYSGKGWLDQLWDHCNACPCLIPDRHTQQIQQLCDQASAPAVISSSFKSLWTNVQKQERKSTHKLLLFATTYDSDESNIAASDVCVRGNMTTPQYAVAYYKESNNQQGRA